MKRWENNNYQRPYELIIKAGWGSYETKTHESEGEPSITFTYSGGSKDLGEKVRISWVKGALHICAEESYSIIGEKIYFPKLNTSEWERKTSENTTALQSENARSIDNNVIAHGVHSVVPGFFLSNFKVTVNIPLSLKEIKIYMNDSSTLRADKTICDKAVIAAN